MRPCALTLVRLRRCALLHVVKQLRAHVVLLLQVVLRLVVPRVDVIELYRVALDREGLVMIRKTRALPQIKRVLTFYNVVVMTILVSL